MWASRWTRGCWTRLPRAVHRRARGRRSDQERAGLDIVTNGDYFLDADFGRALVAPLPAERWKGSSSTSCSPSERRRRCRRTRRGRCCTRSIRRGAGRSVDRQDRAEHAQPARVREDLAPRAGAHRASRSSSAPSPRRGMPLVPRRRTATMTRDDRRELIWDMATAMNQELRELAAAGCKVIQIEEPLIHFIAGFDRSGPRLLDFLVDASTTRSRGSMTSRSGCTPAGATRTCSGSHEDTSYANAVEIYLERAQRATSGRSRCTTRDGRDRAVRALEGQD